MMEPTQELAQEIGTSKELSFKGLDVPWMLERWASETPDKPMMIWEPFTGEPRTWTYSDFAQEARRFAQGLSNKGVNTGDFVIIHLDNSPEFMVAWFACAYLGAVAVSTNTRCVARDLEYFSEHTSAVCAITQPCFAEMISDACAGVNFVACTDNNTGEPAALPDRELVPFTEIYADNPIELRPADHMANLSVQFTSGTTSRPKAVLWSHANGLWAAKIGTAHLRLRQDDRTLIFLPLFHTNAQGWSMLPTIWSGGTFVLQPKFSGSRFWDVTKKYDLTWLSTIPFTLKAVMDQPVPDHNYRFMGVGAHIPPFEAHFKTKILGWWGMTETLTQGIVSDPDHRGVMGSMGRVAPEYDIQIRKPDGSGLAAPGERGLLHIRGVRGVSLFKEYYRNDEANEKAFDEHGWFDTGDIVMMDEDGNLFFSDRDKDMLKVGAENVAASEIESVINQTGWVSECAVVAQKHYMLDEVPVAFVIPLPGAEENLAEQIIDYCKVNLADFKVPVQVILVEALPRSTLEKIAKAELRSQLPAIEA
ncbi:MAG: AMP-binding protein [Pseudomonadales bacterium]|nr:AMP-binding protein [Pseudomonadales bacterium]MBO6595519.1 AMP-binding protein [Pseudomonadales bacterium]MBO6820922.1 AMP-binding protein [Pseudomonadales bacterium]